MRKNKLLEIYNDKRINQAGTDFPCYYDEKNDVEYSASWNVDYAFPFGYWPIDNYGTIKFCVGNHLGEFLLYVFLEFIRFLSGKLVFYIFCNFGNIIDTFPG